MRFEFIVNPPLKKFLLIIIGCYLAFTLLYFTATQASEKDGVYNLQSNEKITYLESFYLSLCVITRSCPDNFAIKGFSQLIATMEVLAGIILFGMFISKLVGARNAKMLEKVYESQFKQKLKEYRNTWAMQRAEFTRLSKKALATKEKETVKDEIGFHLKQKTSQNCLKIISSSMNSCYLFLENNYMESFLDKKFDKETLTSLLHSLKITVLHVRKGVHRLENSKIMWLNYYSRENLENICWISIKIVELVEKRLQNNESISEDTRIIKKECQRISRHTTKPSKPVS